MLINRTNLNAVFTGFKATFNEGFGTAPPLWQEIAMLMPSSTSQELYGWLGTITRFREWIGDRVIQNLKTHDFTIKNRSFENTIGVDRDTIQDDTYGCYSPMFKQLGQDSRTHPDELVYGLFKNGFSQLCYDGQYFFDTDHPVVDAAGVTQSVSNFGGGSGTPWFVLDTSRFVKPMIFQKRQDYKLVAMDGETDESVFSRKEFRYGVDARVNAGFGLWQLAYASRQTLDKDNLKAAIAALESVTGDNGKPLGVTATRLVVPPSLKFVAKELVEAVTSANGATNVLAGELKALSTAYLN
jgi:phage major head subunit gpT-like protein